MNGDKIMFEINGHTKQLGIIGYPVEHTFSPNMHNFISETVHNNYVYGAWCVKPEDLKDAIGGMRALGISGINVTAPHKVEVMKYIDVVTDGKLYGYNTDADGFCMALTKAGIEIENSRILIIGAGGVVRPTLIRLIDNKPKSITVVNRTKSKAKTLAEDILKSTGFEVNTEIDKLEFDIVINTTSAGMEPQENVMPIENIEEINDLSFINENTAAVDMIYNPDKTLFLQEAEKRGAKILNGLGMLIYQGIIAYELFTDTKLPDDMGERIKKEVFGR